LGWKRDDSKSNHNEICYKIIFEAHANGKNKYIGIDVNAPIQGLGNASYNRFIINSDLELVK